MERPRSVLIPILVLLAGCRAVGPAALAGPVPHPSLLVERRLECEIERLETMLELERQTVDRRHRRFETVVRQLRAVRNERNRAEADRRVGRLTIERLGAELEVAGQRLRRREADLAQVKAELARVRETSDANHGPTAAVKDPPHDRSDDHPRHAEIEAALDRERSRRLLLEQELQRVLTQPSLDGEVQALMRSSVFVARAICRMVLPRRPFAISQER